MQITDSNKKIIYITHCSAKKDDSIRLTDQKVSPDKLYTSTPIKRFMKKCIDNNVNWCIFSDKYGIWFSTENNIWYEKHPNKVKEEEFKELLIDFNRKLKKFDEIRFYYNPGRFHRLYKRILKENDLRERIKLFTHLEDIK